MDVHPPLAKLLITLAAWLAGFQGDFDFKDIGLDYLEPGVPYVAMRLLPAILGVLTVPLMFLTLKAYGCRTSTSAMGAVLVTFGQYSWIGSARCDLTLEQTMPLLRNLVLFYSIHPSFSSRP